MPNSFNSLIQKSTLRLLTIKANLILKQMRYTFQLGYIIDN